MFKNVLVILFFSFVCSSNNTIEKTAKEFSLDDNDPQLLSVLNNEELDKNVRLKFKYLVEEIKNNNNYKNNLIVISTHRDEAMNSFLPLAAKKSLHTEGKAIDVLVGDINGDGVSNATDVDIVVGLLTNIERKHPKLVGGVGTYKNRPKTGNVIKDVFIEKGKQMVHFDTRGYHARW